MNAREAKELNRLLGQIAKKYEELGQSNPFEGKNVESFVAGFKNAKDAISSATMSVAGLKAELLGVESGLEGIKMAGSDIAKELGNMDNPLKNMEKGFRKIRNLSEDLSDIQYDLTSTSLKQTKSLKHKINLEFRRLENNAKGLKDQIDSNKLTGDELAKAQELLSIAEDAKQSLSQKVGHQDDLNKALNETLRRQKNISKATGIAGGVLKGMSGFAEKLGFGDMSDDLSIANDLMEEQASNLTDNGNKTASLTEKFKILGTGVVSFGAALLKSLTDPLVIITMLIKAVKFLTSIFQNVLKQTNLIGQSVGIAGSNARKLRDEMNAVGDASQNVFYFTEEVMASYSAINDAAGMNLEFNKENAKTYQDLTMYMGISEESAAKLFKLSAKTGKPYNEMYDAVRDTTQSLNEQTGIVQDTETMIDAIAGASGSVKFNIKGGTEGLVKAAHTAKRLGLSMEEIAASAETHLDFESSIAKEIEAEMFLQKDLNLDKLRYAALTGDTGTQAAEQLRLIKENASALKGNVPKQQAFAAALGMSHEGLMKSLNAQEELEGLSGEALKTKLAEGDEMAKQGKEAVRLERVWASLVKQIKAALEPIALALMPVIMKLAAALPGILNGVIAFASSSTGKWLLGLGAVAVGYQVGKKAINGIKDMFRGTLGTTRYNPMMVQEVNPNGGGGGGDLMRLAGDMLGRRGVRGGKFIKGLSKVFGGKNSMVGRTLRNFSAMNFKRSSMLNQVISKGPAWFKQIPGLKNLTTLNSKVPGGTGVGSNYDKVLKAEKLRKTATATTNVVSKSSKVAPAITKSTSLLTKTSSTLMSGLTKTAKVLGPVGAILDLGIGGFTGSSQADMSAEEQKASGVKEGIGKAEATTLGILTGGAEKDQCLLKW